MYVFKCFVSESNFKLLYGFLIRNLELFGPSI
uniref:Uncharacterized protein n=1 Tax=Arundo donax TaxID=35708 RepID=A0A0A9GHW7_ARUDO